MSALSYLSLSPVPIRAVLVGSPSCSWITLSATSPMACTLEWFAFFIGISSPDCESCYVAISTSDEVFGMRDVEAYSMPS
jgi:hypothetical protein